MIELKNEQLAIRIAELGAELQSVEDSEGREYMWQAGDEWPRHSPILFPIVCSVNNNTYVVDGREYHLPRHGFARDTEFTVISQTDQRVTLALHESEDTLKIHKSQTRRAMLMDTDGEPVVTKGEFKDKPLMNHLLPGASFMSKYSITIGHE
ncbi:MAG: hypothetical protein IJ559_03675 [Prevotella sp.]|nr:hypothetical protein [Prevotella sp.]